MFLLLFPFFAAMRFVVAFVFSLLGFLSCFGQKGSPINPQLLLHKTHAARTILLTPYYEYGIRDGGLDSATQYIARLRGVGQAEQDQQLLYEADLIEAHTHYYFNHRFDNEEALLHALLEKAKNKQRQIQLKKEKSRTRVGSC